MSRRSRCIRSTRKTALTSCGRPMGWGCATSPSAVRECALRRSPSPTTPLFLRAHSRTALGDVAQTHPMGLPQLVKAVFRVERMHLERRDIDQKTRPDELLLEVVIAKNVAHVLAKKAFDALPEFLNPLDILRQHAPGSVRGIRRPRLELLDLLFHLEVPGNVWRQIPDERKGLYRRHRHRLVE